MGMEQYRMRMHHVGIVLPTIEAAKEVMDIIGAEVDYTGYVKAYTADLILQNTARMKAHRIYYTERRRSCRVQQG